MSILAIIRFYIQLIKTPQTGLLIFTAFAAYRSAGGGLDVWNLILAMSGMLFTISGTTALNMVFDRDIDAVMTRTKNRPIPKGIITPKTASIFGWTLIIAGSLINFWMSWLYGLVITAGVIFDLVVYTIWLKRKSPWSIVFGGLSGGMPILAGRVLVTGQIDFIGIMLMLAILLWIPTHILTLAMNHSKDYKLAGVPTFPNVFGFNSARIFIAVTNLFAAGILLTVGYLLHINHSGIVAMRIGSMIMLILSMRLILKPSRKANFTLFKFASLFMAGAMLVFAL